MAERGIGFVKEANLGKSDFTFMFLTSSINVGIYTVDYYVPNHQLGIEVDGPQHFLCPTMEPSGSSLAKHRYMATQFENFVVITGNTVWK